MLGIGHRLEKQTKKKILLEKSKQFNQKYEQLLAEGKSETEASQIIKQLQFERRHEVPPVLEPYKTSQKMNELGGAVHLGYDKTGKTLTQTQTLYKPMEAHMTQTKQGLKFDNEKAARQQEQFVRMKKRIHKDHLAEDKEIDLQEPKLTDYSRNFTNDQKMQQELRMKDKKYNQKMNDLKDYAENYIKSKSSLRKC